MSQTVRITFAFSILALILLGCAGTPNNLPVDPPASQKPAAFEPPPPLRVYQGGMGQ